MKINFYDTRISGNDRTVLVRERTVSYKTNRTSGPAEAAELARRLTGMDRLAEEHCYMLAMNNAGKVLGVFLISKGTVSSSLISAREVYIRALLVGGCMVIICHNHPSGRVEPTPADIDTTIMIRRAGSIIGIPMIDHIIIGRENEYYSFSEHGLLD